STHFLVQRVGFGRASEMCLSGRLYAGPQAHAWGLADRLCAPDDLLPQATALAGEIAANPDPMLRMTKALLSRNGSATDLGAVRAARVRRHERRPGGFGLRRHRLPGERIDRPHGRQVVAHEVVEADVERALRRGQVPVADAGAEEVFDARPPVRADRAHVDR